MPRSIGCTELPPSCLLAPSSQREQAGSGPFGRQLISGGRAKPFSRPSACQPSPPQQVHPWGVCLPGCRGFSEAAQGQQPGAPFPFIPKALPNRLCGERGQ